jgi:hypothetical protein
MIPDKAILLCAGTLIVFGVPACAQAVAVVADAMSGQSLEAGLGYEDNENRIRDRGMRPATTAPSSYQPLSGKERWDLYLRSAFWSPGMLLRAAGPALGAHLNNEPPAWGQGAEGYGKRFANRFVRFALQETYEAAAAAALEHDVRYARSKRAGFVSRAAHALAADFVTYDRNGRRTPHVARIGSVFAAEFTGRLWMPARHRDVTTALRGVGVGLGVSSAFNLIREFAPELKRIRTWN